MTHSTYLSALLLLLLAPALGVAVAPPVPREPLHRQIDRLLLADPELVRSAAGPASEEEFLRRVYLDLVGCIPSSAQARAYLTDSRPDRRTRLIDQLLASPEYARHLAVVFDVMLMERLPDRHVPNPAWHEFLRSAFANNRPWDEVAREILSGDSGDDKTRYRAKFYLERGAEPHLITRDISRLFLGTNLQCAQCHDHPRIDDYLQQDYYGIFAFVNRTTLSGAPGRGPGKLVEKTTGEATFQSVFDPRKVTKTTPPRIPGGIALPDPPVDKTRIYSRRAQLAPSLVRRDHVAFRKNLANRLWAHMLGRGLVEPFDLHHSANPPTHPELLDLLGEDLAARKFDLRGFLRELALTQAYQRSSVVSNNVDPKNVPPYAVMALKPLGPEQFAWSLMQATGLTDTHRLALGSKVSEQALYTRLAPLTRSVVQAFASPAGTVQSFDARMDQALFLSNNPLVRSWLVARPGSLLERLGKLSGPALADELYLSLFTRFPDEEERREVADFLARRPGAYADLAWALLASTEFRFNH